MSVPIVRNLTSGLYDVDVFEPRESLHEAKGYENRILERNYRITGDIKGKDVIIVDDVLTTGQIEKYCGTASMQRFREAMKNKESFFTCRFDFCGWIVVAI